MVGTENIEKIKVDIGSVKVSNTFVQVFREKTTDKEFLKDSGLEPLEFIKFENMKAYEKTKIGDRPVIKIVSRERRGVIEFGSKENRDRVFNRIDYRKKVYDQVH